MRLLIFLFLVKLGRVILVNHHRHRARETRKQKEITREHPTGYTRMRTLNYLHRSLIAQEKELIQIY